MKAVTSVRVVWRDACFRGGWRNRERATKECRPIRICTKGHLVSANRECIRVALSVDEDGDFGDVITIPRSCIESIEKREKEKPPLPCSGRVVGKKG